MRWSRQTIDLRLYILKPRITFQSLAPLPVKIASHCKKKKKIGDRVEKQERNSNTVLIFWIRLGYGTKHLSFVRILLGTFLSPFLSSMKTYTETIHTYNESLHYPQHQSTELYFQQVEGTCHLIHVIHAVRNPSQCTAQLCNTTAGSRPKCRTIWTEIQYEDNELSLIRA
jgi:hypothetical protein